MKNPDFFLGFPLGLLERVEKMGRASGSQNYGIEVTLKVSSSVCILPTCAQDLRTVKFLHARETHSRRAIHDALIEHSFTREASQYHHALTPPEKSGKHPTKDSLQRFFAFKHFACSDVRGETGWAVYDIEAEFERQVYYLSIICA